jgi:hypothetical protein
VDSDPATAEDCAAVAPAAALLPYRFLPDANIEDQKDGLFKPS